jgi:hypothetical protein
MQIADAGNRWGWRTRNVFLDCMVACVTMRDANKSWKISKTKTRMHDMSFKLQFSYGLLVRWRSPSVPVPLSPVHSFPKILNNENSYFEVRYH